MPETYALQPPISSTTISIIGRIQNCHYSSSNASSYARIHQLILIFSTSFSSLETPPTSPRTPREQMARSRAELEAEDARKTVGLRGMGISVEVMVR